MSVDRGGSGTGGLGTEGSDAPNQAPRPGVSPSSPVSNAGAVEPQSAAEGGAPATKEELATDLSEVARARRSNSDKTLETESRAAHAADVAEGVAGKDTDDGTAVVVEAAPTAAVDQSHPGPAARTQQGADEAATATPVPPATAGGPPRTATGGGSESAPVALNPSGTGTPTVPAPASTAPEVAARPGRATDGPVTATTAPGAASAPPTPVAGDGAASPALPASAPAPASTPDGGPATAKPAATAAGVAAAADVDPASAADGATTAGGATKPPAKPAAKPAPPPKPPEPDTEDVIALREVVPNLTWETKHGYTEVRITRETLVATARKALALGYDYLSAITAVDYRDRLEMLYHIYSFDYVAHPGCIVLRLDLPPDPNPLCPSLMTVWPGADFQEREIYDLFGVKFTGHPDLRRILLEDEFPGHPLRKDWTFDYEYVLVRHLRHGAEGQFAPPGGEEGFRRV